MRTSIMYRTVFYAMAIFALPSLYGALTNMDYVNETWSLVWDGTPVTSLSKNQKTYFYCHWESSLGRRMAADIHVCASPANAIKHSGAVQAIEPTANGNCTYWIMRTDYSVPFDDIKRVYSINVGSSGGGSSTVYHQIEKPSMSLTPGATNIWIHWGVRRQNDNGPIWMKVYRSQMTNEQQRLDELPYQEIYAEYDLSNRLAEFYTGGGWDGYWSDTSVKLGVTYAYYVQVGGQGGSIDYSNSYAATNKTTGRLILYEDLRGATHQNPDYYVVGEQLELTEPSSIPCYTFTGWTAEYDSGVRVITANWRGNSYIIRYNSNGGNESPINYPAQYDTTCTILANEFTRSGHAFQGWATETGGDVVYSPGMTVSNLTDVADGIIDLYAVWRPYESCNTQIPAVSVESIAEAGKFQINYTLSSAIDAQNYELRFLHVVDGRTNEITNLQGNISLAAGVNSIIWNAGEDDVIAGQTEGLIIAIVGTGSVGDAIKQERFNAKKYCIVNLEESESSEKWAIQYTNAVPANGWTDEHKRGKMVFRRCPAGQFHFGSSKETTGNLVTLTKDFYTGIFEITQDQYLRIMGNEAPHGDWGCKYYVGDPGLRPAYRVSYDYIRGAENGAEWPLSSIVDDSSFMGILRANTGMSFDLPTEAQWEYACRAGTATSYSYGYGPNADGTYMWYSSNSKIDGISSVHEVGTKKPNLWGIYDMHGNVWEWCLDWLKYYGGYVRTYGEDPVGVLTGDYGVADAGYRVVRGGSYQDDAGLCKSWSESVDYWKRPSDCWSDYVGFRVVINDSSNEPECLRRMVSSTAVSFVKPENPVFTPASGTIFDGSLSVSISCPTEGAAIHYTTDGTDPTTDSPIYRRFRITGKTTVKAVADIDGMLSDVVTAEYASGHCDAPVISLTDGASFTHSNQVVSIQWDNDGVLRYTTDGNDPITTSPTYSEPFTINESTVVKAKVFSDTFFDSMVVTSALTRVWENVSTPQIEAAETFTGSNTKVAISCDMEDAIIRYTLNGDEPDADSTLYTQPFYVTDSCTVKAYAALPDYLDSLVATANVTRVWENVATPQIEAASSFTGSKAKVAISCATDGATIRYTLNGNDPNSHSTKYTTPFYVTTSCTVKAYATKSGCLASTAVVKAIEKVWGIGDTMGKPDHGFSTSGNGGGTGWTRVVDATAPDGEAMKSGAITHNQSSVLSTMVMGPGTLSFAWRTSCEEDAKHEWDHAEFVVDGTVRLVLDGVNSWQNESVAIVGDGEHTMEWRYVKDDVESEGEDAAWVANYQWESAWTATRTTEVPVPYNWLMQHDPGVVDEYAAYEASAKGKAANSRYTVEEAYIAGIDPVNPLAEFTASITFSNGIPWVIWSPNLNTNGIVRNYTVLGKTNLTDTAEWAPTNSSHRFFKVKVEMP